MPTRIFVLAAALALAPAVLPAQQAEGTGYEIEGVVREAESGRPLAGSTVTAIGAGRMAVTHGDGSFHLHGMAVGSYVVRVERLGYRTVTRTVEVTGTPAPPLIVELEAAPVDISGLVVTGTLTERGADEALRPVNVLAGEELQRRLQETVAATLASEPGLTATSMGPATARPVIRGLSGDRVLMLEDGARVGDVSGSGSDHATALDPSSARRIEVVRGPGALLYGSNALGGVVNVVRDEIPSEVSHHPTGSATLQARSVNDAVGGSASARFAVHDRIPIRLEVTGRTASDLATPVGPLENTGLSTWSAGAGSAWVDEWGSVGGAVRYYANDYGIPGGFVGGHPDGVRVEMERSSGKARLRLDDGVGPFESVQVDGTYTWYRHSEIEPPDILGTFFKRIMGSGDVLARHGALGPFTAGAVGARASWEQYTFAGGLFTPDARRRSAAAYLYEEVDLGAVVLEGGVRYDWTRTAPLEDDPDASIGDVRVRTFSAASGSVGLLYRAGGGVTLGASVARAFRTPDVTELFSEGPHLAAYAFEVGNPDLDTEVGLGTDAFVRYGNDDVQAELTVFSNRMSGYVYPRATGRVSSRTGLPIFQYRGEDAVLEGFEGQLEWTVLPGLVLHGTGSYVRGTLEETDEPLPLIPPLQGRLGLEYETPTWFLRGETELAARQDRLGVFETATDGYAVMHASAGLRLTVAGRLNVFTLSFENLGDTEYRNHLSRVKEILPEAGRGVSLTYRVVF